MLPLEYSAPYRLIPWHLLENTMNIHEVVEALGISKRSAIRYLNLLRENGVIRIAEYTRLNGFGGCSTPVYALAHGKKDCPRPKPQTSKQQSAKNRERNRAVINARKRVARAKANGKTTPIMTQHLQLLGLL